MPEALTDRHHIEASRDERGRVGVPQSVERYSMQLQSLASGAPQPGLADGAHGRAVQIAKQQRIVVWFAKSSGPRAD
jgi:hypothetical protein